MRGALARVRLLPEGSENLAADETVLWQGRPVVSALAARLFHLRAVMVYFAILAGTDLLLTFRENDFAAQAFTGILWIGGAALAVAAMVVAAAWIFAATTRYTLTDRRIILQIGVALPIALTVPLKRIAAADLRLYPDGTGDIPVALGDGKLAYLLLWPHTRPWRFKAPQPMLRGVPGAREVAARLGRALLAASPSGEAPAIEIAADRTSVVSGSPAAAAA